MSDRPKTPSSPLVATDYSNSPALSFLRNGSLQVPSTPAISKLHKVASRSALTQTTIETQREAERIKKICLLVDCTASRSKTWEEAQKTTALMLGKFKTSEIGIVIHRNNDVEELGWFKNANSARSVMSEIECIAGRTRIIEGLKAVYGKTNPPRSIYMIGDCFEEGMRALHEAGAYLSQKNITVHAFHEGNDEEGENAYKTIAELTGGVFLKFGPGCEASLEEACEAAMTFDVQGLEAFNRLLESGHRGALAMKDIKRKALPDHTTSFPQLRFDRE